MFELRSCCTDSKVRLASLSQKLKPDLGLKGFPKTQKLTKPKCLISSRRIWLRLPPGTLVVLGLVFVAWGTLNPSQTKDILSHLNFSLATGKFHFHFRPIPLVSCQIPNTKAYAIGKGVIFVLLLSIWSNLPETTSGEFESCPCQSIGVSLSVTPFWSSTHILF